MQTFSELLDHIPSDNLPFPEFAFVEELEVIRAKCMLGIRKTIPVHDLPPLGYPSAISVAAACEGVVRMAEEILVHILDGISFADADEYETVAIQTKERVRRFACD